MKSSKAVSLVLGVMFMFLFAGLVSATDNKHDHDKDKHKKSHVKSNCKKDFPSLSEKNCDAKGGDYSKRKLVRTCEVEKETWGKCEWGYKALFAGPTTIYTTELFKKHKFTFEKCSVKKDDFVEIVKCFEWQHDRHKKGGWKFVHSSKCEDKCELP